MARTGVAEMKRVNAARAAARRVIRRAPNLGAALRDGGENSARICCLRHGADSAWDFPGLPAPAWRARPAASPPAHRWRPEGRHRTETVARPSPRRTGPDPARVLGQGGAAALKRPIGQEAFDPPLLQRRFQGDEGGGMGRKEIPITGICLKPHHAGRRVQPAVQVPGGQFQIFTRRCTVGYGHKSLAV